MCVSSAGLYGFYRSGRAVLIGLAMPLCTVFTGLEGVPSSEVEVGGGNNVFLDQHDGVGAGCVCIVGIKGNFQRVLVAVAAEQGDQRKGMVNTF